MSNTKISALTPGTPAQSTDVIPIDRAGANFSLTASDIVGGAAPANVVSTAGILTANQLVIGAGTKTEAALGALGTTTTVLHGNAAGAPAFSQVTSSDIDGTIQPTASPTFTGTVTAPTIKATKAVSTGINALGNVTGATSVDLSLGNVVTMTLTGATTLSLTNAVSAAGQEITFIITQDGTGSRVITWPTTVPAGIAPYASLTPASVSVFKAVVDGSGALNFAANGPVTVFRLHNSSVTTSIGATNFFTPTVLGLYRATLALSCITAGTTATMSAQMRVNNGNNPLGLPDIVGTGAALVATAGTGLSTSLMVYPVAASSSGAIGYSTVLTNAIGTAVFQLDIIVEYVGN